MPGKGNVQLPHNSAKDTEEGTELEFSKFEWLRMGYLRVVKYLDVLPRNSVDKNTLQR
jgi:hypothetical protein